MLNYARIEFNRVVEKHALGNLICPITAVQRMAVFHWMENTTIFTDETTKAGQNNAQRNPVKGDFPRDSNNTSQFHLALCR